MADTRVPERRPGHVRSRDPPGCATRGAWGPGARLAHRPCSARLAGLARQADQGLRRRPPPARHRGAGGAQGHIFYREDLAAFNFTRRPAGLADSVDRLLNSADAVDAPAIFLESMSAIDLSTGFAAAHPMPLLDGARAAHLDRQRGEGEHAFRPGVQHRLRRRRAPAVHAVSARAGRQSLHRARSTSRPRALP